MSEIASQRYSLGSSIGSGPIDKPTVSPGLVAIAPKVNHDTEAQRTHDRLLDHYIPELVRGNLQPDDGQLAAAIKHARTQLKQPSLSSDQRKKLEASLTQLEKLSKTMNDFKAGNASYSDVGATINNVQVALRAAGLLPNASRNPFSREWAKVPNHYANAAFLRDTKPWTPPDWIMTSNNERDIKMVTALSNASDAYTSASTEQNWKAFEQARNALNQYFNANRFLSAPAIGPNNGERIREHLKVANKHIGEHYLGEAREKLTQLETAYKKNPTKANEDALRQQIERVSDLGYKAGRLVGVLTDRPSRLLDDTTRTVESNVKDPRDKTGRTKVTYVGAPYSDLPSGQYGLTQQTRIVKVTTGKGKNAKVSYMAKGLYLTDSQGVQRGTPQANWSMPLPGAKTPQEAIAMAQANFKNGKSKFPKAAITSGSVAPVVPRPMPSGQGVTPIDAKKPLFANDKVAIYAASTTFVGGDPKGKIRAAIDEQIVPSAARYALQSSKPVQLGQGDTLLNNIGVAMNIPANRVPSPGNELHYTGEALKHVRQVYSKVVEIGGREAKLNVLPVYLEQANGQMIMMPLFKIQRADGKGQQYLDSSGRRYDSLQAFKGEKKLPGVRLYVPHEGKLVARGADGKAQQMQFDVVNNERFIDKAIDITRGVVGGGSTVLAIGSAVGGGGTLVPPLLIGAGVVMAGTALADQWDRFKHGQDISLGNEQARNNWGDIASSVLGVSSLVSAGRVGKVLSAVGAGVGVLQQVDGIQQLVRNWDNMDNLSRYSSATQLAFYGALTVGGVRKNYSAQAVLEQLGRMANKTKPVGVDTQNAALPPKTKPVIVDAALPQTKRPEATHPSPTQTPTEKARNRLTVAAQNSQSAKVSYDQLKSKAWQDLKQLGYTPDKLPVSPADWASARHQGLVERVAQILEQPTKFSHEYGLAMIDVLAARTKTPARDIMKLPRIEQALHKVPRALVASMGETGQQQYKKDDPYAVLNQIRSLIQNGNSRAEMATALDDWASLMKVPGSNKKMIEIAFANRELLREANRIDGGRIVPYPRKGQLPAISKPTEFKFPQKTATETPNNVAANESYIGPPDLRPKAPIKQQTLSNVVKETATLIDKANTADIAIKVQSGDLIAIKSQVSQVPKNDPRYAPLHEALIDIETAIALDMPSRSRDIIASLDRIQTLATTAVPVPDAQLRYRTAPTKRPGSQMPEIGTPAPNVVDVESSQYRNFLVQTQRRYLDGEGNKLSLVELDASGRPTYDSQGRMIPSAVLTMSSRQSGSPTFQIRKISDIKGKGLDSKSGEKVVVWYDNHENKIQMMSSALTRVSNITAEGWHPLAKDVRGLVTNTTNTSTLNYNVGIHIDVSIPNDLVWAESPKQWANYKIPGIDRRKIGPDSGLYRAEPGRWITENGEETWLSFLPSPAEVKSMQSGRISFKAPDSLGYFDDKSGLTDISYNREIQTLTRALFPSLTKAEITASRGQHGWTTPRVVNLSSQELFTENIGSGVYPVVSGNSVSLGAFGDTSYVNTKHLPGNPYDFWNPKLNRRDVKTYQSLYDGDISNNKTQAVYGTIMLAGVSVISGVGASVRSLNVTLNNANQPADLASIEKAILGEINTLTKELDNAQRVLIAMNPQNAHTFTPEIKGLFNVKKSQVLKKGDLLIEKHQELITFYQSVAEKLAANPSDPISSLWAEISGAQDNPAWLDQKQTAAQSGFVNASAVVRGYMLKNSEDAKESEKNMLTKRGIVANVNNATKARTLSVSQKTRDELLNTLPATVLPKVSNARNLYSVESEMASVKAAAVTQAYDIYSQPGGKSYETLKKLQTATKNLRDHYKSMAETNGAMARYLIGQSDDFYNTYGAKNGELENQAKFFTEASDKLNQALSNQEAVLKTYSDMKIEMETTAFNAYQNELKNVNDATRGKFTGSGVVPIVGPNEIVLPLRTQDGQQLAPIDALRPLFSDNRNLFAPSAEAIAGSQNSRRPIQIYATLDDFLNAIRTLGSEWLGDLPKGAAGNPPATQTDAQRVDVDLKGVTLPGSNGNPSMTTPEPYVGPK